MKLALAFSTKDRVELTEQTWARLREAKGSGSSYDLFWIDGSRTEAGLDAFETYAYQADFIQQNVRGGADAAIVFALTQMLKDESYTHVAILENDVLLEPGWYDRTMALFERGEREGLVVGAATARTYEDRILLQRDGFAVLHNAGAGHLVLTRAAAELILQFYRTGWWPDNRTIFAQLSGLDIGRWGAFRTELSALTADWSWDTVLAAHGLATLGLTPSHVEMIGQDPPLEEQGLKIADAPVTSLINDTAFETFRHHTRCVREGRMQLQLKPWLVQQQANGSILYTYFPHQFERIGGKFTGDWRLKWSQGHGPFTYESAGGKLTIPVFGSCAFMVTGGERGAKIRVSDRKSGYEIAPEIGPESMGAMALPMSAGPSYREIEIEATAGARIMSLQTSEPQPWFPGIKFDWNSLPPVRE